ncbi:MAG: type II toxin-antitoxin system prevent-host-death family antitoxin [bacterium]|nr:type II toxin-antitoxin system prevent-host-death family antitoxin [bacterium]MDE0602055.1 type II toxin-antitoxin system prevent-host-death family antitoxin [bacterium]
MTVMVDVNQAKTHLSRLMDRAHAGEQIILAKAGKPYALLGPIPLSSTTRWAGRLAGEYVGPEILLPLPEAVLDAWGE